MIPETISCWRGDALELEVIVVDAMRRRSTTTTTTTNNIVTMILIDSRDGWFPFYKIAAKMRRSAEILDRP
jgi:hypothetical protein